MLSKRTYINFLKGISFLIILLFIPRACIEFRISDEDALKEFDDLSVKPLFDDLLIGGRNIHYAFTNQKKEALVVFIHGSPGSWNAFIDYFKSDSLLSVADVLAIDRPGYGKSDFGNAEPSLKIQSQLINKVIEQFDHKKIILIGHSLGGPVIARLAMDYPSHFDGLIFVAPSINPDLEKKEWFREIFKSRIGKIFVPTEIGVSNEEIISLKNELLKMVPKWKDIQTQSIVIQGTEDWLVPADNALFAEEMLDDSLLTIKMMDGENHFIPWSNEGVITEAIYQIAVPQ
ncbi:MAG: alpha/beta fold hydrolase [Ekhidna sp.]